jgi:hypothetical protein
MSVITDAMTIRSYIFFALGAAISSGLVAFATGAPSDAGATQAETLATGSIRLEDARRRVADAGYALIGSAQRNGDVILVPARATDGGRRLLVLSADDGSFVGETARRAAPEPPPHDDEAD